MLSCMPIRHLQLENYRAFRKAEVRFPEAGLVLVAGPNNAGKTALLSALDALAGDHGDLAALRHGASEEPAELSATFELTQADRAAILGNAMDGLRLLKAGALSSLQYRFEQWQDQSLVLREVVGTWPNGDLRPLAQAQLDTFQVGAPYNFSVMRAFRRDNGEDGRRIELPVYLDQANGMLDVWATFGSGVPALDGFLSAQVSLAPIMAPLSAWRSRFFHFRALRTGTQRSQATGSPERLDPSGGNLAGVLHFLLTDHTELFGRVSELIAEVVPGIGRLRVLTGGNQMRVVFGSGTGALNLKDLGTGVEQLLMTIVVGLTEEPPCTLLIEEPETNLNPAAQRALLGLLQGWAGDRLIVAATHSPVMLDWSPAGEGLWLVTREQGTSSVEQVSADPLPLLDALGVRLSDVLSADRVLVVEGPSDEDVLHAWFPDVLRNPRVAVLHGRGGQNARHAGQLAEWLAGTDRVGLRQVLYLRDRDELAPEMLERLSRSQTVHVLRRREIENYLLDPTAIATVIRRICSEGAPTPDPAAIADALRAGADGLRRKIVVNRTAQRVAAPRQLMDTELRKRLADAGADMVEFTSAVAERLMSPAELTAQITTAWEEAETDVRGHTADELLEIAPGEELLDALFVQYTGRHYKKRVHGPMIAAAMNPPEELAELFRIFMRI
jgi:energy-coupling factor transporter ATP-binding protein EcfA2